MESLSVSRRRAEELRQKAAGWSSSGARNEGPSGDPGVVEATTGRQKSSMSLPWWKRIVLDESFRRHVCYSVTCGVRQFEEEPGAPVTLLLESPTVWDPNNPRNRSATGVGLTYHWVSVFPPTGYVQISPSEKCPQPRRAVEGKLFVNVLCNEEDKEEIDIRPMDIPAAISFSRLQAAIHGKSGPRSEERTTTQKLVGVLRQSFRLVRWRIFCQALLECGPSFGAQDLEGIRLHKANEVVGYCREDLTDARTDYLWSSDECRRSLKKIFLHLEKDINGRLTKVAFVEFALNIINLFMPSFSAQSNIDVAEDEWICRGTKEKPDFVAFYDFWFDLPLMILRSGFMNEEQYVAVWDFVFDCVFVRQIVSRDRYTERNFTAQLQGSPEANDRRRIILLHRKAELEAARKKRDVRTQSNRNKKQVGENSEESQGDEDPFSTGVSYPFKPRGLQATTGHRQRRSTIQQHRPEVPLAASAVNQNEEVFFVADLPRDEIDDILDFCSDASDDDFGMDREPIRRRYEAFAARSSSPKEKEQKEQRVESPATRRTSLHRQPSRSASRVTVSASSQRGNWNELGAASSSSSSNDESMHFLDDDEQQKISALRANELRRRERLKVRGMPLPSSAQRLRTMFQGRPQTTSTVHHIQEVMPGGRKPVSSIFAFALKLREGPIVVPVSRRFSPKRHVRPATCDEAHRRQQGSALNIGSIVPRPRGSAGLSERSHMTAPILPRPPPLKPQQKFQQEEEEKAEAPRREPLITSKPSFLTNSAQEKRKKTYRPLLYLNYTSSMRVPGGIEEKQKKPPLTSGRPLSEPPPFKSVHPTISLVKTLQQKQKAGLSPRARLIVHRPGAAC